MVSVAKFVRVMKIVGLWHTMMVSTVAGLIGTVAFFLSAVNDQPDGGFAGFLLAVLGFKMVFWLLDPLMRIIDENPST